MLVSGKKKEMMIDRRNSTSGSRNVPTPGTTESSKPPLDDIFTGKVSLLCDESDLEWLHQLHEKADLIVNNVMLEEKYTRSDFVDRVMPLLNEEIELQMTDMIYVGGDEEKTNKRCE